MRAPNPTIMRGCMKKTRYRNMALAEEVARRRMAEAGIKLGIYKCFFCGHWHITKMVMQN
jgi:hypothetical protein